MEGPIERLELDEMQMALKRTKHGKAAGPTGVSTEMLKFCEGIVTEVLQASIVRYHVRQEDV